MQRKERRMETRTERGDKDEKEYRRNKGRKKREEIKRKTGRTQGRKFRINQDGQISGKLIFHAFFILTFFRLGKS